MHRGRTEDDNDDGRTDGTDGWTDGQTGIGRRTGRTGRTPVKGDDNGRTDGRTTTTTMGHVILYILFDIRRSGASGGYSVQTALA